jgi:L-fuculose-phosphate aldolase
VLSLEQVKAQLVAVAHKLARRAWVANHDGNVSFRLPEGRFVATPSGMHKADVDHSMLVIVDIDGQVLSGTRKIFSEWELHQAIYQARPDVLAVAHAHPPYATACAVAGVSLDQPVMVEPVVSLGHGIPTVPFFAPKSAEGLALLADAATRADAWILQNHGVLSAGPTLEHAYLRLELVEHQAKIQTIARGLGGIRPLSNEVVAPLLAARQSAGLQAPREGDNAGDLRDLIARMVAEELRRQ